MDFLYFVFILLELKFRLTAIDLERFEQAEGLERHQQILEDIARNLPVLTRTPIGRNFDSVIQCRSIDHILI